METTKGSKRHGLLPWKLMAVISWGFVFQILSVANAANEYTMELSMRLASSMCGLQDAYFEDRVLFKDKLKAVPFGITYVTGCERILITKCQDKGGSCDRKVDIIRDYCKASVAKRIIGGSDAMQNWNESMTVDFPWDVHVRFIWRWGPSFAIFTDTEIENNEIEEIGEFHRCTGTIYGEYVIITEAWCAMKGLYNFHSGNRFVMWFARKRYRFNVWIQTFTSSNGIDIKNGDVFLHPLFRNFTNPPEREHDLAVIRFFGFTGSDPEGLLKSRVPHRVDIHALEIPDASMEFEGEAWFAGWGTTFENITHGGNTRPGNLPGYGTVLQKIKLTILPYEGRCERVLRSYLKRLPGYKPSDDYADRYICAAPDDPVRSGLCAGDIGGSLVCQKDGKKYFCGMRNSWGIVTTCPSPDHLEIFLKMGYYKEWIEQTVGPQQPEWFSPGPNYYVCRFHCNSEENKKR